MQQEAVLSSRIRIAVLFCLCLALSVFASSQTKASIDVSETLFSVVAAINVCGYDRSSRRPLRSVRRCAPTS